MNNARRELLGRAVSLLDQAYDIVSAALDQEQDCLDNMPENLQDSERYQKMESAVDCLEGAIESIDEARDNIKIGCKTMPMSSLCKIKSKNYMTRAKDNTAQHQNIRNRKGKNSGWNISLYARYVEEKRMLRKSVH